MNLRRLLIKIVLLSKPMMMRRSKDVTGKLTVSKKFRVVERMSKSTAEVGYVTLKVKMLEHQKTSTAYHDCFGR